MLGTLDKGGWTLRLRDGAPTRHLCVRDGREFIQLRHLQANCSRFVVRDEGDQVVIQYTCPGNGYGLTTIRREASGLVQVQSRGIAQGAPFAIDGEARHDGTC